MFTGAMTPGDRVCTPSGRTGTIVSIEPGGEFAYVLRDDLGWPVPYDFFELEPLGQRLDEAAGSRAQRREALRNHAIRHGVRPATRPARQPRRPGEARPGARLISR